MGVQLASETIQACTNETSFRRGEKYYREGRVQQFVADGEQCSAVVVGSDRYAVTLDVDDLSGSCDCYAFDGDLWCKHMVAVGLTVANGQTTSPETPASKRSNQSGFGATDAREYIDAADETALRMVLHRTVEQYPELARMVETILNPSSLATEPDILRAVKELLRPVKQARRWDRGVEASMAAEAGMQDIAASAPATDVAVRGLLAAAHYVYDQLAYIDDSDAALQEGCASLCAGAIERATKLPEGFALLAQALARPGDLPLADHILHSSNKQFAEQLAAKLEKHLYKRDESLPSIDQGMAQYLLANYYADTGDGRLLDLLREHQVHANSAFSYMVRYHEVRQEWPELVTLLWRRHADQYIAGKYGKLLRTALKETGQQDKLLKLEIDETLHAYDIRRALPRLEHILKEHGQSNRLTEVVSKLLQSKSLQLDQHIWLLLKQQQNKEAVAVMIKALDKDAAGREQQRWMVSPYAVIDTVVQYTAQLQKTDTLAAIVIWKKLLTLEAKRMLATNRYVRFEEFADELLRLGKTAFVRDMAQALITNYPTRKKLIELCQTFVAVQH